MKQYIPAVALFIIGLLFVIANIAFAGERPRQQVPDINNYYNSTTIINKSEPSGAVLGFAAAQCHLTQSHRLLQWCIGSANYQNESAINFEMGQKYKNTLFNFSIGIKEGDIRLDDGNIRFEDVAIGVGASGTF